MLFHYGWQFSYDVKDLFGYLIHLILRFPVLCWSHSNDWIRFPVLCWCHSNDWMLVVPWNCLNPAGSCCSIFHFYIDVAAAKEKGASRRVREAQNAANRALESAIQLRSRAQMLMANAELAAYKSVMALKIADAIGTSESPELSSSILD